jgi:hypothetical protein
LSDACWERCKNGCKNCKNRKNSKEYMASCVIIQL